MKLAQDWEAESDCVHVDPNDDPFRGRMRFHQSWYRACVLHLPPGVNPASKDKKLYGNVLRTSDGEQGYNLLTEGIRQVARDRLAEGGGAIGRNRLHCNLLSSQPMCFNLFGPLQLDPSLATTLVSALPGLPEGIHVTAVRLEFAPDRSKHLMDLSAFDAFIEYRRGDRRGFIGVETKLTEPFSQEGIVRLNRCGRFRGRLVGWSHGAPLGFEPSDLDRIAKETKIRARGVGLRRLI